MNVVGDVFPVTPEVLAASSVPVISGECQRADVGRGGSLGDLLIEVIDGRIAIGLTKRTNTCCSEAYTRAEQPIGNSCGSQKNSRLFPDEKCCNSQTDTQGSANHVWHVDRRSGTVNYILATARVGIDSPQ